MVFAIGVAVICYMGFILLFPKAVKDPNYAHTEHVLDQLYADTRALSEHGEAQNIEILRSAPTFEDANPLARLFYQLPGMRKLYARALQAGLMQSVNTIPLIMFSMWLALFFVFVKLGLPSITLLLTPFFVYFLTLNHFNGKIRKRNHKFLDMFPDVLDMMVRSVRSGFPVNSAIQMVAENMEAPVSTEFKQVADELALGRSLNDALKRMGHRINESDIQFFIVVLAVQQETGGNLAEVMSNLSNIIRKRKQLRKKVRAMTAEGRATAWVLGALPLLVFMMLFVVRRDYLEPLWTTPAGHIISAAAISLVVLAIFIVRKMVDVDV